MFCKPIIAQSRFNLLIIFLTMSMLCANVSASPDNIAPKAAIHANSEYSSSYAAINIIDGNIAIKDKGEWAIKGSSQWWGGQFFPEITLTWPKEVVIEKAVIYDRPSMDEHTSGGMLLFSDGSRISVNCIPNDGGPKEVTFAPKKVNWIKFTASSGKGLNLGLSEIEVFPALIDYPDLVSTVDPYIETSRGRWFFCVPGSRPYGMISASPFTNNKNQMGGGYNYNHTEILGFAHIHAWIMSAINLMPVTGKDVDPTQGQQGWKSSFKHESEIIQPGYQRLFLDRYSTWVEMTCTDRVAMYRMKYTKDAEASVLLSLGGYLGAAGMVGADVKKVSNTRIEGSVGTTDRLWGGPRLTQVFFVFDFDKPFKQIDGWKAQQRLTDIKELKVPIPAGRTKDDVKKYLFNFVQKEQAGLSANYDVKSGDEIQVKVAISYTSIENARNNLNKECPGWDFDAVRADARKEWNEQLGHIKVKGGTRDQTVKFYTDLWHVLLGRHKIDDYSGDYPVYMEDASKPQPRRSEAGLIVKTVPKDKDGKPKHHMYNSDALWLTMWNLNVLWGLGWPEMADEFSASFVQYADNGGLLPRGPSAGGYTFIMTGCPATSLITSAYQKGLLTKTDIEHAYETMKRNHMPGGMMGVNSHYLENGWSPNGAGVTLQWAFEDWALAQMAKDMGKTDDYNYFMKRSSGWPELYNPEIGLILPKKSDGTWAHTNPLSGSGWVEANSWQGTFSVSHGIGKLAELMGGKDKLCEKLNHAFEKAAPTDFVFGYGSSYVSYANQPGCSNAHVFNHSGQPWLSQYWVRRVNEQAYGGTCPNLGYGGHDEDQGQMGGVSALMSIGLFSVGGTCGQEPIYEITSGVFDEVEIELDPNYYPGKTFKIRTYRNSKENMYIQKIKLNGKELNQIWFDHADYAKGGLLEIWLGPEPNKTLQGVN